jgi:hypothetical protein
MCREFGGQAAVPSCVFGTCSDQVCVCREGFIHDAILGRYFNCSLPLLALYIFCGTIIACCVLSFVCNLYVALRMNKPGQLLRTMSLWACAVNAFLGGTMVDLMVSTHITPWGALLLVATVCCIGLMVSYLLLSVLSPVSKFSNGLEFKFRPWKTYLVIVQPIIVLVGMTVTYLGAFLSSANEPGGNKTMADDAFNDWLLSQYAVFLLLVSVAGPAFLSFTHQLVAGLESARAIWERILEEDAKRSSASSAMSRSPIESLSRKSAPAAPAAAGPSADPMPDVAASGSSVASNAQKHFAIVNLLDRVKYLQRATVFFALVMVTLAVVSVVMQVVFRTFPFNFAVYLTAALLLVLWTIQLAAYSRQRVLENRRRGSLGPLALYFQDRVRGVVRQHQQSLTLNSQAGLLTRRLSDLNLRNFQSHPRKDNVEIPSAVNETGESEFKLSSEQQLAPLPVVVQHPAGLKP